MIIFLLWKSHTTVLMGNGKPAEKLEIKNQQEAAARGRE